MVSTWLIVAMAASRYVVVVYPLHARDILSARKTLIIIAVVFIGSAGLTTPSYLQYSIRPCLDFRGNLTFEAWRRSRNHVSSMIVSIRLFYSVRLTALACGRPIIRHRNSCVRFVKRLNLTVNALYICSRSIPVKLKIRIFRGVKNVKSTYKVATTVIFMCQ